jgi:ferredoxin--NADP+ reductase
MKRFPQCHYVSVATREGTPGEKVYLQDMLESGDLEKRTGTRFDPERTHVFICGNPKMIGVPERDKVSGERHYPKEKGAVEVLEKRGFRADDSYGKVKGNIHFEEYW